MFRFPWSNFHELNLDWILEVVKEAKEIFVNGRSDIDNAVETANEALEVAEQAAAAVIADGSITISKLNNEVLKTTAYVIVGNRADEPIPVGAFVYLRKSEVAGLTDGIYIAAASIPAGAIVTPAEFQQPTELGEAGALNVLKNTLNQLETNVGNILPVITGSTNNSGYTINTGDYFEANGALYKATATIPTGEAWSTSKEDVSNTGINNLKNAAIGKLIIFNEVNQTYNISMQAYAVGQIVTFSFVRESDHVDSTGWTEVGVMPIGYRPKENLTSYIIDGANNRMPYRIVKDGTIQMYSIPNAQIAGVITYGSWQ